MASDQVVAAKAAERVDEGVAVRAASALVEVAIGPSTDGGPAAMALAVSVARIRGITTATRRPTVMDMGTIMVISGIDTG
ncbi:MAG: hypothetical protein IH987_01135 [Planctomycetes bacterium]|nr:hypothetical protein [Planctomycetota bacterium]